jgi:hypothetical protein
MRSTACALEAECCCERLGDHAVAVVVCMDVGAERPAHLAIVLQPPRSPATSVPDRTSDTAVSRSPTGQAELHDVHATTPIALLGRMIDL